MTPIVLRIQEILVKAYLYEAFQEVITAYQNKTRHYHNLSHIEDMLNFVDTKYKQYLNDEKYLALQVAIIFHDIVYNPRSKTNEQDSVEVFVKYAGLTTGVGRLFWDMHVPLVVYMICATQNHTLEDNALSYVEAIVMADLDGFNKPFPEVWKSMKNIMKEYAFVDFKDFKKGRLEFIEKYHDKLLFYNRTTATAVNNIEREKAMLEVWEPKIAVYPGSFNPFHIGHLNILEKANRIFDKVIVAVGQNPDKPTRSYEEIPAKIADFYQVDFYNGMLTDYIKTKDYPVTIIRGLRNSADFVYEDIQYAYLQDMMPEINVVSIVCDREYRHVSSSAIR